MRPGLLAAVALVPLLSGCTVLDNLQKGLSGGPKLETVTKLLLSGDFAVADAPLQEGASVRDSGAFTAIEGSVELKVVFLVEFSLPAGVPADVPQGNANASVTLPDGSVTTYAWDRTKEVSFERGSPLAGLYQVAIEAAGDGRYEIRASAVQPVPA